MVDVMEDDDTDDASGFAVAMLDHLMAVCDQLQRLKAALGAQGIAVPDDLGNFGPATDASARRLVEEAYRSNPFFKDEPR